MFATEAVDIWVSVLLDSVTTKARAWGFHFTCPLTSSWEAYSNDPPPPPAKKKNQDKIHLFWRSWIHDIPYQEFEPW